MGSVEQQASAPYWSVAGVNLGLRLIAPVLPIQIMFGLAFGALAAQKGLSLFDATMMSLLVFAGASQFVAMEIWAEPLTFAAIVTLTLVTAMVNMRFFLMSASLRPWLGPLPAWQSYSTLATLTDPGWIAAMRYRAEGGGDAAVFLAGGLAMWVLWIVSTVPGYLIGTLLTDPKSIGLDLVMPAFFTVMLVPLWRGGKRAISWAIAGVVALLMAKFVPGYWFIVGGALAGSIAAGFIDD
jgi:4-azaleucine resistance transporter AzlC